MLGLQRENGLKKFCWTEYCMFASRAISLVSLLLIKQLNPFPVWCILCNRVHGLCYMAEQWVCASMCFSSEVNFAMWGVEHNQVELNSLVVQLWLCACGKLFPALFSWFFCFLGEDDNSMLLLWGKFCIKRFQCFFVMEGGIKVPSIVN